MVSKYFHSVGLAVEKCTGCVTCSKRCPTEAIRIRGGKARITGHRCIDCGECIRSCETHAKTALTDSLKDLKKYKYNIAVAGSSLYGQFGADISVADILRGLLSLGFDEVFEVARGAELAAATTHEYLKRKDIKRPAISLVCPAVVRLIQVKFPELLDHLIPVDTPLEIASQMAQNASPQRLLFAPEEIGVWFITPCPAKMTAIKQPLGYERVNMTGAIAISEIYPQLLKAISSSPGTKDCRQSVSYGISWAMAGGESAAVNAGRVIVVDGIHSVSDILEQVALGKLNGIDYIEALACNGGCIGGALTVENRFVAQYNMMQRLERIKAEEVAGDEDLLNRPVSARYKKRLIEPRPIMRLDDDMIRAMQKVEMMEKILNKLPGLDCGSCGSPNCKSLAEDIVQGIASEDDCHFVKDGVSKFLREK